VAIHHGGKPRKPDGERLRRNKPIYPDVPLEWDGEVRGTPLPKKVAGQPYDWCDQTKEWWFALRRSEVAMVCLPSDWFFLLDTALIYDKMWRNAGQISAAELRGLANEFRIRMAEYGDTWQNRLKLRIKIKSADTEAGKEAQIGAAVDDAVDYLAMVNAQVAKRTGT